MHIPEGVCTNLFQFAGGVTSNPALPLKNTRNCAHPYVILKVLQTTRHRHFGGVILTPGAVETHPGCEKLPASLSHPGEPPQVVLERGQSLKPKHSTQACVTTAHRDHDSNTFPPREAPRQLPPRQLPSLSLLFSRSLSR